MASAHMRALRLAELDLLAAHFRPGSSLLELGAGAGWQAAELAARGFRVEAVDVPGSTYADERVFPVREYDGERLPFADGAFDGVYSSNVLEHVPRLEPLLEELARVLRPGGRAVHVLPTSTWRLWTTLAHPLHVAGLALGRLLGRGAATPTAARTSAARASPGWTVGRVLRAFVPPAHGERGNFLTELAHFHRRRWNAAFATGGWSTAARAPNRIFYTGCELLGARLSLGARRRLSRVLGSTCLVWVLEPVRDAAPRARRTEEPACAL